MPTIVLGSTVPEDEMQTLPLLFAWGLHKRWSPVLTACLPEGEPGWGGGGWGQSREKGQERPGQDLLP